MRFNGFIQVIRQFPTKMATDWGSYCTIFSDPIWMIFVVKTAGIDRLFVWYGHPKHNG